MYTLRIHHSQAQEAKQHDIILLLITLFQYRNIIMHQQTGEETIFLSMTVQADIQF